MTESEKFLRETVAADGLSMHICVSEEGIMRIGLVMLFDDDEEDGNPSVHLELADALDFHKALGEVIAELEKRVN